MTGDRLTLTVDDYTKAVPVSDHDWQTPEAVSLLLDAAEQVAALSLQLMDARDKIRFWRAAYLIVCAQFFVVCVAAVWGWAR